jgi:hypothetical protein
MAKAKAAAVEVVEDTPEVLPAPVAPVDLTVDMDD